MNWTLEVVGVPVSDLDRSKSFYADQLGFTLDHDTRTGDNAGFIQLTPTGSGCSVVLQTGTLDMVPGSLKGVQLIINDLRAAHAELVGRGVKVSEIQVASPTGTRPATDDDDLNNAGVATFEDPDGNGWVLQQITARP